MLRSAVCFNGVTARSAALNLRCRFARYNSTSTSKIALAAESSPSSKASLSPAARILNNLNNSQNDTSSLAYTFNARLDNLAKVQSTPSAQTESTTTSSPLLPRARLASILASIDAHIASTSPNFDLDTDSLLFLLAHPNLIKGPIGVARGREILKVMVLAKGRFALSAQHFNLLLAHLLKEYIDAEQFPYQPKRNPPVPRVSKARVPIPSEISSIAHEILTTMETLETQPDGWTYSFKLLLNKEKPHAVLMIWSDYCAHLDSKGGKPTRRKEDLKMYNQAALQPWAYNALLSGIAQLWRENALTHSPKSGKVITHQITLNSSRQAPPSAASIWAIVARMKKSFVEPTRTTDAALLLAMTSIRPLDFKAMRKARSKLVLGQKSMMKWDAFTFEAALEGIAETGTVEELDSCLEIMHGQRITHNRSLADSVIKFYALNNNAEKVLQLHQSALLVPQVAKPTHSTYTSLLEVMSSASETSSPASQIETLCITPLLEQLESGDPTVGPATLDLVFATLTATREFAQISRVMEALERDLLPTWRAKGFYGFSLPTQKQADGEDDVVVLGQSVVEALMSVYGHEKDSKAALELLEGMVRDARVARLYSVIRREENQEVSDRSEEPQNVERDFRVLDASLKTFAVEFFESEGEEDELTDVFERWNRIKEEVSGQN
ncbi:hypothetical protein BJ741DRAFT_649467 [Chytriomyces cf. hyalinus JEL632]|nr:hypothetical protein BJ741DRAFT_649467 [Chytriomyces cf. hyalinus JEL632]